MRSPVLPPAAKANDKRTARCSCGSVEIEAYGKPITSAICYCDSCQQGAREIEALANAPQVANSDGGTAYILYRKDRVVYNNGRELLKDYKIEMSSTTNRVVATCCNTAMLMRFDDAKHWIPMYRASFQGDAAPVQWRICTQFKPTGVSIPTDVPSSEGYPPGFMWKLLTSRIEMLLHR